MNTKVKKIIALMLLAVMTLSMTACNVGGSEQIAIKGCFVLEPNEEHFKKYFDEDEGLDNTLKYFFVVYDVTPKQNTEMGFSNTIKLTLNNNNVYEDVSESSNGTYLAAFLNNCGYMSKRFDETLYSGNSSRVISVFAINKNDINENTAGKIEIKLSDDLKETKKIAAADIKTIDYMDGVFAVEDDPVTYMLKCSLKAQSDDAYYLINLCCTSVNSLKMFADSMENVMTLYNQVILIYGEHGTLLISAASTSGQRIVMEMDNSHFTIDEIRERFPDVADEIEKIRQVDDELRSGKTSGGYEIYAAVKNAFYSVRTSISNIQDDIEKYY